MKVEIPIISNATAKVHWIEFQFVDTTLEDLLDKLILWKDQDKGILDKSRKKR